MAGRQVEIPEHIERILPYDAKTSILLFPVAYDKMIARAMLPGHDQYTFISDDYNQMQEVDMKSIEEILVANPQLIIAGSYASSKAIAKYDKLQGRSKIPVVVVDLSIDHMDETYLFLAELFSKQSKSKQLCNSCAAFITSVYQDAAQQKADHATTARNIYYTLGPSGLMTDPAGSKHTEAIDYMGLHNVADIAIPTGGHANINMEQVLQWNPDFIFTAGFRSNKSAYSTITESNKWKSIAAVQNNQVYKIPSHPFSWFDNPPSVNRIPSIIWLNQIFYGLSEDESKAQIIKFYQLFYRYQLTDKEYLSLFE